MALIGRACQPRRDLVKNFGFGDFPSSSMAHSQSMLPGAADVQERTTACFSFLPSYRMLQAGIASTRSIAD
jgi:hypothetical protein